MTKRALLLFEEEHDTPFALFTRIRQIITIVSQALVEEVFIRITWRSGQYHPREQQPENKTKQYDSVARDHACLHWFMNMEWLHDRSSATITQKGMPVFRMPLPTSLVNNGPNPA